MTRKKLNYEDVKSFIEKENYKLLSKEYVNAHSKLKIKCDKGHILIMNWNKFKQGIRCLKCYNMIRSKNKKLNYEDVKYFIEKENYKLLSKEYVNNYTKLELKCDKGHIFKISMSNFKRGYRCTKCSGNIREYKNKEIFKILKKYDNIKEINGKLKFACKYCGKYHLPERYQITNRIRYVNGNYDGECNFYCSDNCKQECPIYGQKLYPKGHKPATSREVQPQLRKLVFERDNYTCQKCNKHQNELEKGLHCHHIDAVINNPIESADVDNCITLCKSCHKKVHKLTGCGYHELRCS